MDIVTLALAKKGAKSYTDTKLGAIAGDFNYLGSVATIEDLPSSANVGDEYTVGNQGPYVYNGTEWVAAAQRGPQGIQGPEGPQGEPGKDGKDGGEINAYKEIKKIKNYLYETYYDECDYEYANEYFEERKVSLNGACSAVRKGNFYGRNFDWVYDEGAEFIVRTPRIGNRYASMGISGHIDGLTNEFVESGEFNKDYKIVPFKIVDGINEYGLVANTNVVPNDYGTNTESIPAIVEKDRVCNIALVRYILDNFKTAQEAVEYIRDYVVIYPVKSLEDMHYELHVMVADENKTYVLEVVENIVRVIDVTNKPMMTNFYLYGVTFNEDGKTYYPAINDATHNAKITNGVTDHGCGLERYAKMVDAYSGLNTLANMMEFMNHGLRYTKAYTGGDADGIGEWYTEFVDGDLTVESSSEDFEAAIAASQEAYQHRSRDPQSPYFGTWQSTHSVVYDIEKREMNLVVQEDNNRLKYNYIDLLTSGSFEIPKIDVTASMIISQDPVKIQGNAEMNVIMTNIETPFVILDASAVGLGSTVFHKAKMRTAHYWLLTQTAGNFNNDTQQITDKTLQSVIYNDTTMIAVYEESVLQDKLTAGSGFRINRNVLNYDPDVLSTVDYVDGCITDTTYYVDFSIQQEHLGRVAGDNLKQDKEDNNLVTRDKNIVRAINETNSIAKGANQAVAFEDYESLIDDLNDASNDKYRAGQNFYVKTLNVPDMWIMSVEPTIVPYTYRTDEAFIQATEAEGGCQVGHYKVAQLETQKVNLTDYYNKTESDNKFQDKLTAGNRIEINNNTIGVIDNYVDLSRYSVEDRITDEAIVNQLKDRSVIVKYNMSYYRLAIINSDNAYIYTTMNNTTSGDYIVLYDDLDDASESFLVIDIGTASWEALVSDVQINGTSILNNKVANITQNGLGIATEEWVFTLSDNTTVTKNVKVSN